MSGWWTQQSTNGKRLVAGGAAALVVVVIVVLVAVSTGGKSSNTSNSNDGSASPVHSGPSTAEVCVRRWTTGASSGAKSQAGVIAHYTRPPFTRQPQGKPYYTYVSVGFSASVPDRCLITVANVDTGTVIQFQEKTGGVFDYGSGGGLDSLPDSAKQWDAHGDEHGTIALGAP